MIPVSPAPLSISWVICLCAGWCGLCRDYRALLEAIAVCHPGLRFAWLDIEDQAGLVGDLDIETFPTLLVADEAGVQFFGPVAPHAETLSRLLAAWQAPGAQRKAHEQVMRRLLQALPALPELWLTR